MKTLAASKAVRRCAAVTALAIAAVCLHPATAEAQIRTWLGATSGNWSSTGNWLGGTVPSGTVGLRWSGTSTGNLTSTNDISGLTANALTFTGAPGPVTLTGNSLMITNTVSTATIQTGTAAVTINMPLSMKFNTLTLNTSGGGPLTINGVIGESGTVAGISFKGASGWGAMTLNGTNTFSGAAFVDSGTLTIGNLDAIGVAQALGSGTTIRLGYRLATDQGFVRYTGPATTSNKRIALGDVNVVDGGGGFLNDGTGAVIWTGSMVTQSTATRNLRPFTLGGSNTDDNEWRAPIVNVSGSAPVSLTKAGVGKWILSGTNTYSGTTTVAAGVLGIANNLALQNSPLETSGAGTIAITVATPTLGGLVGSTNLSSVITSGYGSVTNLTLNPGADATFTYGGTVSDGAAGMTLTKTGAGTHVLTGANSYTGGTIVNAGILQIGNGGTGGSIVGNVTLTTGSGAILFNRSDAISFPGVIAGSGTVAKQGAGTLTLSGSNTFTRAADINDGLVAFDWIANGGQASPLGSGNSVNLGSGTFTGGLRYTGTGQTSNRTINLAGTTGGGGIEANGTGPLVLTGTVSATGVGSKTLTLGGSNTGVNSIGPINGTDVSVAKTGPGTWRLTGNSGYSGRLAVSDGTVLVVWTESGNDTPYGSNTGTSGLPLIGSSAVNATGTAALLVQSGTVTRGMVVAESNGSQVVAIGGVGTGTAVFSTSAIRLGRSVTLQASTGGAVEFNSDWRDFNDGTSPAVAFNVGSTDNAGTVVLKSAVPDSITGVNVRRGTLRLANQLGATLGYATPVTLGEAGFGGTLDVNAVDQPLGSLSFTGVGSTATTTGGSVLRLFNSGTNSASVTVSGTGHVLSASTALDSPASFNVNAGGTLLVSGLIATGSGGGRSFTKTGPGTLELGAANTFSGPTIISAGTLALGAAGSFANSSTITVGDAGSSGAVLDLTGKSGGFMFGAGQTLKGGGTVKQLSNGTLTVSGLFSPGNSPGLFTYDGGTTLLSGTTLMEIAGTARATSPSHGSGFYDAVNISGGGLLSFGGTLELTFSSLFDTDTFFSLFSVLDSASLAGNFADVNVSGSFYTGLSWSKPTSNLWKSSETTGGQSLEFNASTGKLVIVVPEPSTLVLLAIGGAAVVGGLRRLRTTKTFTASRSRAAGSCAARPGP